jgi:NDP-sugar pyrophosphorylase family protein
VGAEAVVEDSILGPESEVGPGVNVRDSVLADRTVVAAH